jgi:hypothetical protein
MTEIDRSFDDRVWQGHEGPQSRERCRAAAALPAWGERADAGPAARLPALPWSAFAGLPALLAAHLGPLPGWRRPSGGSARHCGL